ncbi:MAG: hypothetical protein HC844_17630 [Tabrizicola sp.]|nr:hypothetical protein [Tabrizicola sp.]
MPEDEVPILPPDDMLEEVARLMVEAEAAPIPGKIRHLAERLEEAVRARRASVMPSND